MMPEVFEYPDGATPLDPDALEGLKFPHVETRGDLDQLEQANIQEGLHWLERHKDPDILSVHFACMLHGKLFGQVWDWAGHIRKRELSIGIDPLQVGSQLAQLLGNAQFWIDEGVFPPLEIASRLHHQLVYIHPFYNGNGRHARIYADAVLQKLCGVDPIDWTKGVNLQKENDIRGQYIQALRDADAGNYAPLFTFTGAAQD